MQQAHADGNHCGHSFVLPETPSSKCPTPRSAMTLQVLRAYRALRGEQRAGSAGQVTKAEGIGLVKAQFLGALASTLMYCEPPTTHSLPLKGWQVRLQLLPLSSFMLSVQRNEVRSLRFFSLISSVPRGALLKTLISSKAPQVKTSEFGGSSLPRNCHRVLLVLAKSSIA